MASLISNKSRNVIRIIASIALNYNRNNYKKVCTVVAHGAKYNYKNAQHRTYNINICQVSCIHTSSMLFDDEYKLIQVPPLAESLSEGDIRWEKSVGDPVDVDEVIAEIETDKTSIPIISPVSGVIEELLVEDGATVEPGADIVKIKIGAPPPKAAPPPPTPKKEEPVAAPKPPEAKQVAQAAPPPPSKPASTPKPATAPTKPQTSSPISIKPSQIPGAGIRTEHKVKANRMRLRIAQRLKEAQNTYAMLTTFNEIDMTNIMEMRKNHQDAFVKKHGLKLGFMSAFVKASAHALQDQPSVNAVMDAQEIVYRDYVDISVAVSTPKGLVVPIIKNVENMNFADIERAISQLGEKARAGSLAVEDMDGGTFTISNGGVFGSLMGTPIINPPQSAILGMHGIFNRPVAINNEVKIRPMMYVALTYDHRLVDGREAVTFLRLVKSAVEDPKVLLLDL